MEEGATYYRMQTRPAPSSHGMVQPAPVQRITKNSQEFQARKQIFAQFPQEWKDDVLQEKDSNLRLRKFEQYRRQLMGEERTSQPQQQQQQQQVVMNGGGGGGQQQAAGGQRQMPAGVMTNRTVHVVARNPQQPQTSEGNYVQSNGTPMMVRRAPVHSSDPNRASPIPAGVRIVGQQPVRGPNGARLLPARTSSQYQPQQAHPPQFVRRVVTSASSPSLDEPGAKRAKLTPSPPNYGQQQVVYVQQQQEQGGQQQQPQQVVYIQGRAQSPNGTVYITRQQQGSDQVMMIKEEARGVEPGSYGQQQQQGATPQRMMMIKKEPREHGAYAQQGGAPQRRQQVVYVRTADGQQQGVRRAAAGASPQMAQGRMVSPPGVSAAPSVPTSSSAIAQALHSKGPPVLQRMVDNSQPQHRQPQQHYLQPSGGTAMHKSSSMPVFSNASPMPRSPQMTQMTSMRSPAAPAWDRVTSNGGQIVNRTPKPQEQHTPMVHHQQHQEQVQLQQQPQMQHQQMQQPPQQQQQMTMGTPQHHQVQQQQVQMQQHPQQVRQAPKATPEYKEALDKLRKRLLEDFHCLARRQRIDGVKPSPKFEGVMQVLCMRKIVPIENLEAVGRLGALIVEQSRLAWPLTKEIREFIRAGMMEKACDVKHADPWESVRDKFVSPIELPPEVLAAIS